MTEGGIPAGNTVSLYLVAHSLGLRQTTKSAFHSALSYQQYVCSLSSVVLSINQGNRFVSFLNGFLQAAVEYNIQSNKNFTGRNTFFNVTRDTDL